MTRERDGQMALADALLATAEARSVVALSLSPVFERRWPSVYTALQRGRLDSERLSGLYLKMATRQGSRYWVVDATTWPRSEARTLPERGFHHVATTTAGTPVGIGHRYATVGVVADERGSWVLPLKHERVPLEESEVVFAARQVRQLVAHTTIRPLVLADSLYAGPLWLRETHDLPIDTLARLRPNRALYRRPVRRPMGRPALDGPVLNLRRPETWQDPDDEQVVQDSALGTVTLSLWRSLHFKTAREHEVTVIRVALSSRAGSNTSPPKPLWLMYAGATPFDLSRDWACYLRRYAIEHWYRFIKNHLLWNRFAGTGLNNTQLWSWLVTFVYWQLWLGRAVVADQRHPWEKPIADPAQLSPGRVRRSMALLLSQIGTPATPPKTRGKSHGRAPGSKMMPRIRFPCQKKGLNSMSTVI